LDVKITFTGYVTATSRSYFRQQTVQRHNPEDNDSHWRKQ